MATKNVYGAEKLRTTLKITKANTKKLCTTLKITQTNI